MRKNSPEYDREYFQKLKNSPGYERKKVQNRKWNLSEEGQRYKKEYMRQWRANKRAQETKVNLPTDNQQANYAICKEVTDCTAYGIFGKEACSKCSGPVQTA